MTAPTVTDTHHLHLHIPTRLLDDVLAALAKTAAAHGHRTVLVAVGGPVQLRIVEKDPT